MGSLSETVAPSLRTRSALDDALDHFDRAWLEGRHPSIEDVIATLPLNERADAIEMLVEIDAEHRLDVLERIEPKDYHSRFPENIAAINRAFERLGDAREGLDPRFRLRHGVRLNGMIIGEEVGRGGVAVVYRVVDEGLSRPLALKTLLDDGLGGQDVAASYRNESRWRLQQEAALTAQLSHPGVPPVHGVGELPDGRPYFCMRLIEGETFSKILQREPTDTPKHLRIYSQVAQILSAAHQQNIIHRDVKPSNVMVGKYGEVQLMDWGMGKQLSPNAVNGTVKHSAKLPAELSLDETCNAADSLFREASLSVGIGSSIDMRGDSTSKLAVLGTLSYMPPEQARGMAATHDCRTDVFTLGAILCQILTGHPPYRAESAVELWKMACDGRLSAAVEAIDQSTADPELKTLAKRCLSLDPADRPASAQEVSNVMQAYFESINSRAEVARIERAQALTQAAADRARAAIEVRRRRTAVALSVSLLALIAGAIAFGLVFTLQRQHAERIQEKNDLDRAKSLVSALLIAPPEGFPYAVESLRPLQSFAKPYLSSSVNDQSLPTQQRLHAAMAQNHFGDADSQAIVRLIATCAPSNCPNVIAALRCDRIAAARSLHEAISNVKAGSDSNQLRCRAAICLLYLDDDTIFEQLASRHEDVTIRLLLIQTFAAWHGDMESIEQYLGRTNNSSSQAVICQAVAFCEPPDQAQLPRWATALAECLGDGSPAYLRSSAVYLATRWRMPDLPPGNPVNSSSNWRTTANGLTMVKIPPGTFSRSLENEAKQPIVVKASFWISDREIPAGLYAEYKQALTNRILKDELDRGSSAMPTSNVSWSDAATFANWLSQKEGLKPCYVNVSKTNDQSDVWHWDIQANGYRLPTEAEWEWAARGGGTDAGLTADALSKFAVYGQQQMEESGTKLPNFYGLFDMYGNLQECCFDAWLDGSGGFSDNHDNPTVSIRRVVRGGSYRHSAAMFKGELRSFGNLSQVIRELGIRLVQSEVRNGD